MAISLSTIIILVYLKRAHNILLVRFATNTFCFVCFLPLPPACLCHVTRYLGSTPERSSLSDPPPRRPLSYWSSLSHGSVKQPLLTSHVTICALILSFSRALGQTFELGLSNLNGCSCCHLTETLSKSILSKDLLYIVVAVSCETGGNKLCQL